MLKKIALTLVLAAALPVPTLAADAAHGFDWNLGTWKTHIQRAVHPRHGSTAWVSYDGVVTVRPLLGGAANVEEVMADGASHLEFLAVRTFNAQTQQWILNQADASGAFGQTAFGTFARGRGVFYDVEASGNRTVLVRQTFFDITASSYAFEQSVSQDGGRTWEPNFRARLERTSAGYKPRVSVAAQPSRDFDFNYGTWHTQIRSRDSLSASRWHAQSGTVTLHRLWNSSAMLEEIVVGGTSGFSGITLYLFDPQSREWSQTFIDSAGTREPSMVGTFAQGRGELFAQATSGHAMVIQRGLWSNITPNAHHFEIDMSQDGGGSWHPVFVAALTRIGPGV